MIDFSNKITSITMFFNNLSIEWYHKEVKSTYTNLTLYLLLTQVEKQSVLLLQSDSLDL
jgi:hypothetical protein